MRRGSFLLHSVSLWRMIRVGSKAAKKSRIVIFSDVPLCERLAGRRHCAPPEAGELVEQRLLEWRGSHRGDGRWHDGLSQISLRPILAVTALPRMAPMRRMRSSRLNNSYSDNGGMAQYYQGIPRPVPLFTRRC